MNYSDIRKKVSRLSDEELMRIAYECYDGEMTFREFVEVIYFEADQNGDDITLYLLKEMRDRADECGQAELISSLADKYLPKLKLA